MSLQAGYPLTRIDHVCTIRTVPFNALTLEADKEIIRKADGRVTIICAHNNRLHVAQGCAVNAC